MSFSNIFMIRNFNSMEYDEISAGCSEQILLDNEMSCTELIGNHTLQELFDFEL